MAWDRDGKSPLFATALLLGSTQKGPTTRCRMSIPGFVVDLSTFPRSDADRNFTTRDADREQRPEHGNRRSRPTSSSKKLKRGTVRNRRKRRAASGSLGFEGGTLSFVPSIPELTEEPAVPIQPRSLRSLHPSVSGGMSMTRRGVPRFPSDASWPLEMRADTVAGRRFRGGEG